MPPTGATRIYEGDELIDEVYTRFGFRQFYSRNADYELNGIKAKLRADAFEFSWHEGYRHGPSTSPVLSTKELIPAMHLRLVDEYKKLNLNALRPHKASGLDILYDHCDEIGMMVLDEAPFWQTWIRTDERAKKNFEAWIARWIRERRNHPSIVAWVAANECWEGPIAMINIQAVRANDTTRPVFHDGPRKAYPGDALCYHYTGGYPIGVLNTDDLYHVYKADSDKPTGEGESLFADGFPLLRVDGTLSDKRSERGKYDNPDMISQAQWIRSVCRLVRAMRYAGIDDARLYASWMYCFESIEADIFPQWEDIYASGIQPIVLHRPICNLFSDAYPEIVYGEGREYFRNSFSPVAVFDKQWDEDHRIGASTAVYQEGQSLERELVVYNDEFSGGETITVDWFVDLTEPRKEILKRGANGSFTVLVPYGERETRTIEFAIPDSIRVSHWLDITLKARKGDAVLFEETNRIGAVKEVPSPMLSIPNSIKDLGVVLLDREPMVYKISLVNQGGGRSVAWTVESLDAAIQMPFESGNLRGEQDVFFSLNHAALKKGRSYDKKITFRSDQGGTRTMNIIFKTR